MSTNQALISQLTGTDCLIYLTLDPNDTYKTIAMYRNLQGDTGVLNAAQLGLLGLTFEDLPTIVKAPDLAEAIQGGDKVIAKMSALTFSIENSANISGGGCNCGDTPSIDLDEVYTEVDSRIAAATTSIYRPKGSVETAGDLPLEGNAVGDVRAVRSEGGAEYVWIETVDGFGWDPLGSTTDLSNYYTKGEVDDAVSGVAGAVTALGNATDTKFAAEEAARIQAVNAVANSVAAEESARTAAVQSIDEKISFGEIINRIWIYGGGIYDLNLMVKPGMYYCSTDANVVGTAMTNLPEGTAEGCLMVTKNSQIFVEGGTSKGRFYYRYQTGAGPEVTEYTEAWVGSAMLSDVSALDSRVTEQIAHITELHQLLVSANETLSSNVSSLTEAHYDLDDRVTFAEQWFDFSSFEVCPNDAIIPVGESELLGGYVNSAIPVGMRHDIRIHTYCALDKSDVVIDWGDGKFTKVADQTEGEVSIFDTASDGEISVLCSHTYESAGKYIVRIFGHKYYHFDHPTPSRNLICRVFDGDLPMSSHLRHFGMICYGAARLLKVQLNGYDAWIQDVDNFSNCFHSCPNLVSVKGFRAINARQTDSCLFINNVNLVETDYQFPSTLTRSHGIRCVFENNPKLAVDISKLFPVNGFTGTVNVERLFYGDIALTGIVPASKLWEDTDVIWVNTSDAFTGCSDAIRAQVPVSWGGTNTEIEAKLQSGYWVNVKKHEIEALESKLDSVVTKQCSLPVVQIITGGTSEDPVEVSLVDGNWYLATCPFTGTLPEAPAAGTLIQISVTSGQEGMRVVPSGSDTIEGETNPCILGVFVDGTLVDNETHRFVYNNGNWILL